MFANIFYDIKQNKVHLWEYINGQKTYGEYDYIPYCYIYDNNGEYSDLTGKKCKRKEFTSWYDQKAFLEKCETLEGDVNPEDRFLIDRYAHIKEFLEVPSLHVHYIDIETETENGFPDIDNPRNEINLITVYSSQTKKFHMFGLQDYTPTQKNVEFNYCETEEELLRKYFKWHKDYYPDVLTGWNIQGFDIPYIINRARYLLSESIVKKYSPINILREIQVRSDRGQNFKSYAIAGISILDYMSLYKTFSINERESYSLNYISQVELGKEKIKYDGSLNDLWKNDWKKFCEYNLQDVQLILDLETKLGYLKLVQAQSYMCRCAFEKYGSTLKKHDNYLLSTVKDRKVVLPTTKHNSSMDLPGGYVSEPKTGFYKNVVSYDFTSLYPHIIMAMNISPEKFVGKIKGNFSDLDLEKIVSTNVYEVSEKKVSGEKLKEFIQENNLILTPNGVLFKQDEGFIPKIIKHIYAKRKEYKNKMQDAEKLYLQTKDEKYNIEKSINDSLQYATKILANSLYGALANAHFRLFNNDFAAAITLTGQKVVQYTSNKINDFFEDKFKINDVALYEDTDSCYVNYTSILKKLNITETKKYIDFVNTFNSKYLMPYLEENFIYFSKNLHGIEKNYFDLKREVITIGAIFIQKKKYALYVIDEEGITLEKPKLKVKGIEIVRSSTPGFCRTKLKEVVEHIFTESSLMKTTERVKEIKKDFMKQETSDIAFPRGINDLEKYIDTNGNAMKGCPIHVRAASIYNKLLVQKKLENKYEKIRDGDKIKFIYIKDNNPLKENIIGFKDEIPKEFDFEKYLDYDLQFDKSFLSPIENIAKAMGWKFSLDTEDMSDFF